MTRLHGTARKSALSLAAGVMLVGLAAVPASTAATAAPADGRAVIQYTEYGIPHITASDYEGLGYGSGYASAKDNLCTLADAFMTENGERSLHLGADAPADPGLGQASTSLDSDLYFQRIKDSHVVEKLARQAPPNGPDPEAAQMVRGYAKGYNRYLRQALADGGITDPACRGKAWVRPITPLDVYRHVYAISTGSGSGVVMDGIARAQPPTATGATAASRGADARSTKSTDARSTDARSTGARSAGAKSTGAKSTGARSTDAKSTGAKNTGAKLNAAIRRARDDGRLGSNAIGVGADGTTSGRGGVLLANPHYPWHGPARLWQSQLTIPGRVNVSGASLLGFPGVLIGHNADVAWSHTVSTAATYGLYEVALIPGKPTHYLVDGKPEKMTSHRVRVRARQADGSTKVITRTLWNTRYGPVIDTGPGGVPLPWARTAHTIRDANATNLRAMNTWLGLGRARTTDDVLRAQTRTQGLPWVNTVSVDSRGKTLYSDIQVVPHVTDDLAKECSTDLGRQVFPNSGISVLDGSRGACAWGSDKDAVQPGLFGPHRLPTLTRTDYVTNSNNSPWLANPEAPLTGYPRGVGDIGTARSFRTQEGILAVQRRLAGTDGLPGKGFSRRTMEQTLFGNRSRTAELAASSTAAMCARFPDGRAPSSHGPVDVSRACGALARWDGRYTLDSRASLLFARFTLLAARVEGGPWRHPFDVRDPLHTPNTLAVDNPAVQRAFGDAAAELKAAGIPLDAPLRDHQYVTRGKDRIPVHGAPSPLGVLNVITPAWDPKAGHTDVITGSSFIQVTEFGRGATPRTSSLLTYAQSSDPTSPHFRDQTKLFSRGVWIRERFTQRDILDSPRLRTQVLTWR
ncbi:penicillin acylase family protein [Streptomyces sp. NPDC005271]|uniref:penicillin acylase family protein n=1 Tax=unclassified Streptomyces TaxID=2593676 RepID=UPI0033BB862B